MAGHSLTLVDDTYNANPDSVRAAIDVLAELPAPRLLVLGDMGEVGDQGSQFHAEVGATRARRASSSCSRWAGLPAMRAATSPTSSPGDPRLCGRNWPRVASMLVKGSRFMRMERVVEAITAASQQDNKRRPHAA
jgi:UDP-N-acetylmuramoyl-tripeptide--D-alanyl-D-alanine ligase